MEKLVLNIKKLNANAKSPTLNLGMIELYSAYSDYVNIGSYRAIGTGIAVEIPQDYIGVVVGVPSLTIKYGIAVDTMFITTFIKGEIKVIMRSPYSTFALNYGTHIANLILFKTSDIELEVSNV